MFKLDLHILLRESVASHEKWMVGPSGFGGIYATLKDGTVSDKIHGMYVDFGGTFDKDQFFHDKKPNFSGKIHE